MANPVVSVVPTDMVGNYVSGALVTLTNELTVSDVLSASPQTLTPVTATLTDGAGLAMPGSLPRAEA